MPFEFPLWLGPAAGQSEGPPFGAQQYRQLVDLLFAEGVLDVTAGQLAVTPATGLTLNIATGAYVIDGDDVTGQGAFYGRNLAPGATVTLAAAPATGSRIDLIVVKVNDAESTGQATNNAVPLPVTGVATTGTPVVPTVPASAIALAQVLVAAGTSTITSAMVTDRRTQAGSSGYGPAAPPMTTTQRNAITSPAVGLMIFNTTTGKQETYGGSTLGWLSGARLEVSTFLASGTWTKPAGAVLVLLDIIGAGGSGAGGGGQQSVPGGSGGGGGGRVLCTMPATVFGTTVPVTVGAGGVAPAPTSIAGPQGVSGGNSAFGFLSVSGGAGGVFQNSAGQVNGGAGGGVGNLAAPIGGSAGGGVGGPPNGGAEYGGGGGGGSSNSFGFLGGSSVYGGGGGGGAGGIEPGGTATAGAAGGNSGLGVVTGGAGGAARVAGTAGTATVVPGIGVGGGGGGGGGSATAGSPPGAGADGAIPGGGGGGGGTTNQNGNGARGGSGARGEVRVFTICV